MLLIALFLLLPLQYRTVLPLASKPITGPPPAVYVIAGQSNASPRDAYTIPTAPEDSALVLAHGNWVPLRYGPGTVTTHSGLATGFTRALARKGVNRITLVACAEGSGMGNWQPPPRIFGDFDFYGRCLRWVREVSDQPISGWLFYEGENEAVPNATFAGRWGELFTRMVTGLRREGDFPIVFVRIARNEGITDWTNLRRVWADQDAIRLPGVRMVDAEPADLVDGLHVTHQSGYRIGERAAEAMHP